MIEESSGHKIAVGWNQFTQQYELYASTTAGVECNTFTSVTHANNTTWNVELRRVATTVYLYEGATLITSHSVTGSIGAYQPNLRADDTTTTTSNTLVSNLSAATL